MFKENERIFPLKQDRHVNWLKLPCSGMYNAKRRYLLHAISVGSASSLSRTYHRVPKMTYPVTGSLGEIYEFHWWPCNALVTGQRAGNWMNKRNCGYIREPDGIEYPRILAAVYRNITRNAAEHLPADRGKSVGYPTNKSSLVLLWFLGTQIRCSMDREGRRGSLSFQYPDIILFQRANTVGGREKARSHENGKSACVGVIGHCLFTVLTALDIAIMRNSLVRVSQRRRNSTNERIETGTRTVNCFTHFPLAILEQKWWQVSVIVDTYILGIAELDAVQPCSVFLLVSLYLSLPVALHRVLSISGRL